MSPEVDFSFLRYRKWRWYIGPMDLMSSESSLTLRRITGENLESILALSVSEAQKAFVASNERSIAQARFDEGAWFRAVYAADTPVGFVLLHDETLCESPRQRGYCYLWRMMIDHRYQLMGFGRRTLRRLIAHVKTRPDVEKLHTSWRHEEGNAGDFYVKFGFKATGINDDGEVQAVFEL